MVTIVLLNEAWMCAMPWETCLRSFFLNVFFLPFFSGAAGPPAATGFAILNQSLVVGRSPLAVAIVANVQGLTTTTSLCLGRSLLLRRHRAFARTFPGAGIGVGALSANGQVPAMAISAIGADFDEALDVHRNLLAQ